MNSSLKPLAVAIALAALSAPALADEAQSFCDLTQTQAEVQKHLLGSAQLFVSTGDPQTGSSTTVTVGLSKSLSKHLQARTTGALADATCDSYRADRKLAEQAQNVEQRGDLLAFTAMEPVLRQALDMAKANVARERELLNAHMSTLMDVKGASDSLTAVRELLTTLEENRSRIQDQLPEADVPLRDLVQQSIAAKTDMASQTSKLAAESSWDVSLAAGVQSDPGNGGGRAKPFVGVTLSYSFGAAAAYRAANRVSGLAAKYVSEERDGPEMQYRRALATVRSLIKAERDVMEGLDERKALVDETIARLQGIESDDAQRAMRQAKLDQLSILAQQAGANARMDYLRGWLARNDTPEQNTRIQVPEEMQELAAGHNK